MKELVQKRYQKNIVNCVITVPAHFNNNQRMATKAAGKIAGLNVLQILNEPTAASYEYGVTGSGNNMEKTVLVYDFGGGTLDVSVLTITDNTFDVFRHYGNMHLGGEDINDILEQYFINDLKQKYPSVCINKRLKYEIRKKCNEIKNRLSYEPKVQTVYNIDTYDIEFEMKLTRAKFENLCKTVFKEAMKPIDKVLKDADLTVSQIDEVILVGGTTKIPKIREMIQEFFQKEINFSLNPFESVARGAAIHAANLINIQSKDEKRTITMDVTPLTLGIETAGKFSTPIIIRGTNIPFKTTKTFTTHRDNQESVTIKVLEGERAYSNDNHQLGTFQLLNLPKAKRGDLKIEVTYFINKDGILDISANLKGSKDVKRITIGKEHYCFDEAVINTMKLEAEKFLKADRITKKLRKEMEDYENFLYNNLHLVEGKSEEISKIYKDEIEWTEKNEYLKSDMLTERKKSFHERIQIFKE
jgi:molecular chaperone DnaK (HSP70)